jgi:hypothetical protein
MVKWPLKKNIFTDFPKYNCMPNFHPKLWSWPTPRGYDLKNHESALHQAFECP